jgi:hypothetical protein
MASRKSRPASLSRKGYPFVAAFLVHPWRRFGGHEAEVRAASTISGGDFRSESRNSAIANMAYYFKTAGQAHAMQVWFEHEGDGYDPWDEKLRRWRSDEREERRRLEIIEGLAVNGTWDRLRRSRAFGDFHATRALLRELEPWIDSMEVDRVMVLMPPRTP